MKLEQTLVGLAGSLRAGSYNRMALQLAGQCLPTGWVLDPLDWRLVPPFDADLQAQGMPHAVEDLSQRIRKAGGVLIASPEYNFGIPGMLKNLLDWLSRGENPPLAGKPVALFSAATGPLGGARVQYELRRVLLGMNAMVLQKPEVFIGQAASKFSEQGACNDEVTRVFVSAQMQAFAHWVERVQRMDND
ncbi:FMN-dependent NADPH-azoreductase [Hydrogenophaga sp. T4]|nr:FMN-dependent NADPH-azoreductase [Hydrogenophaga sp. T4]